jgi:hypothetical protein
MAQVKVLINDGIGKRKVVEAEVIQDRKTTILVRLPDGNIITRKKKRDLPKEG